MRRMTEALGSNEVEKISRKGGIGVMMVVIVIVEGKEEGEGQEKGEDREEEGRYASSGQFRVKYVYLRDGCIPSLAGDCALISNDGHRRVVKKRYRYSILTSTAMHHR